MREKFSLFKHIRRHLWQYIIALTALILSVTVSMIVPEVQKHIVDDVIVDGKTELLIKLLVIYACLGASRAVLQYVKEYSFDSVSSKVVV